jgi:predicted phosphodiesterase
VAAMRIAIVSDLHGNQTAFETVLADLQATSPDLVLHGGDLADGGSSPAEIVDHIRALGWRGVVGNTDEMLFNPESLKEFAANQSAALQPLFATIEDMAAVTREKLGEERLAWLCNLPRMDIEGPIALVHAGPHTPWRAPKQDASDAELKAVYGQLGKPVAVYGHIHHPFVRSIPGMIVANTGSVGLSYDGDPRAAYLLLDGANAQIRRVAYDLDKEVKALSSCGLPHYDWVVRTLTNARFQMP